MVRAEHDACGSETRIRLPGYLSPAAVRRVVCRGCAQTFETPGVEELKLLGTETANGPLVRTAAADPIAAAAEPAPAAERARARWLAPSWLRDPGSRAWRLASIPVAAVAVACGLLLIQGGFDETSTPFATNAPAVDAAGQGGGAARPDNARRNGNAAFVKESSFSLALPSGWERTPTADGATFAAATDTGDGDVSLWVERDASLSFADFEARSLDTLEALAGSARVAERVVAPTAEATVVRLAADNPPGSPSYEVTLRAAGPYRYYLATTVQPDASDDATDGAELIHGSFQPIASGEAK